jgi:hypothetical protein
MKNILVVIIFTGFVFSESDVNQTFKLQDGTIIVGSIQEDTDTNYVILTKYGSVTIDKNKLIRTQYEVKLKSGETYNGLKLSETDKIIKLETKLGILDINKSDIQNIKESGQVTELNSSISSKPKSYQRNYSLFDVLFDSKSTSSEKDIKFAMGEERLIDTFFDPTAYVLDNGTLYLSGLSFAFGLSDKIQLSSRWVDFFWGNFNLRPKYMLYHKGNWEKESALAIGAHFHTYWKPNKVVWQEGKISLDSGCWNSECPDSLYFGGYFPINSTIKNSYYHDNDDSDVQVEDTDDLDFMVELFSAYTISKARKGMRGRVSSTVGASLQIPLNADVYPHRIFASVDIDLTPKLKMVGEVFYDPFFLDLNQRTNFEGPFTEHYAHKLSESPVTKDDFNNIRPIHFDFGFIYAVNENFRFGVHNQIPIIAFYWKF